MRVAVCVPYRAGVPQRDRAWEYVRAWWGDHHPVYVADGDKGMMNRSRARNTAAAEAGDWDVAIFGDADTIGSHPLILEAATIAYETGHLSYPFTRFVGLTQSGTNQLLAGKPIRSIRKRYENSPGGIVCIRRDLFDEIGGWDEQFVGWGFEDVAFARAARTLGGLSRLDGEIMHLYHPASPERNRNSQAYKSNRARVLRYKEADGNPDLMRRLLDG